MTFHRLWSFVLRLLPRSFRERHAEEMTAVLEEHLRGRAGVARLGVWARAAFDVATMAATRRLAGVRAGGSWRQDLAFAARSLRRRPLFTGMTVLTLGLGLGVTTAVASVVWRVVLAPTPYEEPARIVQVALEGGRGGSLMPAADVSRVAEGASRFLTLGVSSFRDVALGTPELPERVRGVLVTGETLAMLGVPPALGRLPDASDDRPGGPCVTALSHGVWTERFGGTPDVIGSDVRLDGAPCTVVAVMPEGFAYPGPYFAPGDLWLMAGPAGVDWSAEGGPGFLVFGRLRPGVDQAAARGALEAIPTATPGETRFTAVRWAAASREASRRRLLVLLGAAALVLLIACVNVVALQVGRYVERRGEIATRMALGASGAGLARLVVTETVVLTAAGALVGLAVAAAGVDLIVSLRSFWIPRMEEVRIDGVSVAVCLALSAVAGLAAAWIPALGLSDMGAAATLRRAGRGVTHGMRFGRALVGVETALALVLTAGALLLLQSYRELVGIDPGFRYEDVLHARITPPAARYPGDEDLVRFFRDVEARVDALPDVREATLAWVPPGVGADASQPFTIAGREPAPGHWPLTAWRAVGADYLRLLDIPLVRGRWLEDGDPRPVVVNETFESRFFPEGDAVGARLHRVPNARAEAAESEGWTIVGVAADAHEAYVHEPAPPVVYARWEDAPTRSMAILAWTVGPPLGAGRAVQEAVAGVDPEQPVFGIRDMEFMLASEHDLNRLSLVLLALFAGTALVLAVAGIYGVVAQVVGRRRREMGVRIALGAVGGDVLRLIVGDAARFAALGAAAGLVVVVGAGDRLGALTHRWQGLDPPLVAGAAAAVVLVAVLAAYVPARRAAAADPVAALRSE